MRTSDSEVRRVITFNEPLLIRIGILSIRMITYYYRSGTEGVVVDPLGLSGALGVSSLSIRTKTYYYPHCQGTERGTGGVTRRYTRRYVSYEKKETLLYRMWRLVRLMAYAGNLTGISVVRLGCALIDMPVCVDHVLLFSYMMRVIL
ncbi:unnamed protein product [Macrosiphum euphorbiae]|uniref:Uncharacterized protein n=1 Tax=Macrosiphum euphorbiae TaxID=13131 RepID=A0AAV0WFF0_9HEMI|nr:unnamed protein product [Macrosiphum euphorbiae]